MRHTWKAIIAAAGLALLCAPAMAQSSRCASPSAEEFAKAPAESRDSAAEAIDGFASAIQKRIAPLEARAEEARREAGRKLLAVAETRKVEREVEETERRAEAERRSAARKAERERLEAERQARWEAGRPAREEARRREREERRRREAEFAEAQQRAAEQRRELQRRNSETILQQTQDWYDRMREVYVPSAGGGSGVDGCKWWSDEHWRSCW